MPIGIAQKFNCIRVFMQTLFETKIRNFSLPINAQRTELLFFIRFKQETRIPTN